MERGRIQWFGIDGKRLDALKKHLEGCNVELVLQKERKQRTVKQNAYYWGVVVEMLAEAAGHYEAEEMHDALREKFLRKYDVSELPTVRSSTELTTVEWEEYMQKCRMLGAEMFGIYIPEPNEVAGEWTSIQADHVTGVTQEDADAILKGRR